MGKSSQILAGIPRLMGKFKPDPRKTTYQMLASGNKQPPKIIFSTSALKWTRVLMDAHTTEVGWYATVDELGDDTYYIKDVFYPKHELMTGSTCEISSEGEAEIMGWLMEKEREDDISKIKFWGHKHPGASTSPSGQDEKQAIERMNSTQSYLIRAICGGDEISVSFFDYDRKIRFDNVNWEVEEYQPGPIVKLRLDRVLEILHEGYDEESAFEKAKAIIESLTKDDEMEEIKAKVTELKKVNVPKPTTPSYGHTGYRESQYPYNQTDMWSGGKNTKSSKKAEEDTLHPDVVAALMDEVEMESGRFQS